MKKIVLLLLSIFFCGNLYAAEINEIVFFGDSLSDNGNLYNVIKVIPKTPPYYNGRFANGPVWAELVGQYYKNKLDITYNDYAFGGATVLSFGSSASFFSPMNLEGEIDAYYENEATADKSRTLFVFWLGANDYLTEDGSDGEKLSTDVVDKLAWAMNTLITDGAKYFLVINVPDLSIPPLAAMNQNQARMHYLSTMHNQKLEKMLINLHTLNPQVRTFSIDVASFLNDIVSNMDKYNQRYNTHIRVTDQYCWQGGMFINAPLKQYKKLILDQLQGVYNPSPKNKLSSALHADTLAELIVRSPDLSTAYQDNQLHKESEDGLCDDPDEYMFWDPIHPTQVIHQLLSYIAIDLLESQAADLLKN